VLMAPPYDTQGASQPSPAAATGGKQ